MDRRPPGKWRRLLPPGREVVQHRIDAGRGGRLTQVPTQVVSVGSRFAAWTNVGFSPVFSASGAGEDGSLAGEKRGAIS